MTALVKARWILLGVALLTALSAGPVSAALLIIDDSGPSDTISFFATGFDNFLLDGNSVVQGIAKSVAEADSTGVPITHSFFGLFAGGATPESKVVAFAEDGTATSLGASDILTFTYSPTTIVGTFVSDRDPVLFLFPAGATVVSEAEAFDFSNGSILAFATSDSTDVPEPASLLLLGSGLVGLAGVAWRGHKK